MAGSAPLPGKTDGAAVERWAWGMAAGLGLLAGAESLGAGHSAFLALVAALPHLPLLAGPLLGLAWSLVRRCRRAVVLYLGLTAWILPWSGLNLPLVGASGPERVTLEVATFNLHELTFGASAIREALEEAQAEVLCLQEWPPGQDLEAICPGGRSGWHVATCGQMVILSRHRILSWRAWDLADLEGLHRPALVARLDTPGGPVTVVNLHLPVLFHPRWLRFGLAGATARVAASQGLRRAHAENLNRLLPSLDPPVLLVGDFNGSLRDPAVRRVQGEHVDAFQAAGWGFGYTFASFLPLVRIDHVLAPGDWTVQSARVLSRRASDHRPLTVRLGRPEARVVWEESVQGTTVRSGTTDKSGR